MPVLHRLRTPVSVAYPVNTVACAAIWLAARETDIALPTSPPWWEVFDAKLEDLQTIAMLIKQLYTRKLDRTHLPLTIGEIGR